jgi:hypothetical protein
MQFTKLRDKLQLVQLILMGKEMQSPRDGQQMANGQFLVQSAYQLQFEGRIGSVFPVLRFGIQIPLKCQFFAWLASLSLCLTADNLEKRAVPCNPVCSLCNSEPETTLHLFASCAFSLQVSLAYGSAEDGHRPDSANR